MRTAELTDELSERRGVEVIHRYEHALNGFTAEMSERDAQEMAADPRVQFIEEDAPISLDETQLSPPWGLDRVDQRTLPIDQSYTYNDDGAGVHAYVIDTGIRITHQEFGGRAHHVFSAVNDPFGMDDCNGHGTHVAGTVGGATYGVAKNVELFSVRVLDCIGGGTNAAVIAGMDWVTANRVLPAVVNMSIGGPSSPSLDQALANSVDSGVTYVVAAGNDAIEACGASPARSPRAITVGATDNTDTRAAFSNYGFCLDIFAPGVDVLSSYNRNDTSTRVLSGTSMATPHVAGAVALYLGTHPTATPAAVATALYADASANTVLSPGFGSPPRLVHAGCIGTADAIPPVVTLTAPQAGSVVTGPITLSASASDNVDLVRVDFFVDDTLIEAHYAAPFDSIWSSKSVPNGAHVITARARDRGCNVSTSTLAITTDNFFDVTAPTAELLAPGAGTISGDVVLEATAADDVAVDRVEFYADAILLGSASAPPYSVDIPSTFLVNGSYLFTARAIDTSANTGDSDGVAITVDNAGTAAYDPTLRAPRCNTVGPRCDSQTLLTGCGRAGPEPNQPNTIGGSCADGFACIASSTIDRLSIAMVDRTDLAPGGTARVEATIHAFSSDNFIDFFYTNNATWPVWTSMASVQSPGSGVFHISTTYTLPPGQIQAIHASMRYLGAPMFCTGQALDDADDLIFTTNSQVSDLIPPTVTLTNPVDFGPVVNGPVTLTANATDNVGVTQVQFLDGGQLIGTDTTAPYSFVWNTSLISWGVHLVSARAFDAAGNSRVTPEVFMTVDNLAPTVTLTSPLANANLRGSVLISATATDNQSVVSRVEFYAGATLIASDTISPYSAIWDTSAFDGSYSVTARGYDALGNIGVSPAAPVVVDNAAPTVAITFPANGAGLTGFVNITANASDNRSVQRVDFFVDAAMIFSDTSAPYSTGWNSGSVSNGPHVLTARAYDPHGNTTTSAGVNVTTTNASAAVFNPTLLAPWCSSVQNRCDTGVLVNGRATLGPEPNPPNSIAGSCSDGTGGTFHADESLDRMAVSTLNGAPFAAGARVRVEALVWAGSAFAADRLDIFHAPDANSPVWTLIATLTPPGAGQRAFSTEFNLPAGTLQAIRGSFRSGGTATACTTGTTDDHDDLVFAVSP